MKLRPLTKDDYDFMRELDKDPNVVKYLGHGKVRPEEETRKNFIKIQNDYKQHGMGLYLAECKATGEILGRTGIIPWVIESSLMWEVGYSFKPTMWGKGYATEAAQFAVRWGFESLKLDFMISLIHPQNKKSIKVAEKAGMKYWKPISIGRQIASTYRINNSSK